MASRLRLGWCSALQSLPSSPVWGKIRWGSLRHFAMISCRSNSYYSYLGPSRGLPPLFTPVSRSVLATGSRLSISYPRRWPLALTCAMPKQVLYMATWPNRSNCRTTSGRPAPHPSRRSESSMGEKLSAPRYSWLHGDDNDAPDHRTLNVLEAISPQIDLHVAHTPL